MKGKSLDAIDRDVLQAVTDLCGDGAECAVAMPLLAEEAGRSLKAVRKSLERLKAKRDLIEMPDYGIFSYRCFILARHPEARAAMKAIHREAIQQGGKLEESRYTPGTAPSLRPSHEKPEV